MTNSILFSIIIPTYNRASLLKRCLDSVLSQSYQKWEAIVVDNFSEDNTEEVVKSYNDRRITYVKIHNHGIISVSRNKALDLAKGEWVAFLDSDDAWLPTKLEKMRKYTDDYDLIYHGYRMDVKKKYPFQRMNNYFYEIKESRLGYVIERGDPICPSCSCVSRKLIGESRFEENPDFRAVEDYDFFLQIIEKSPRIKYIKKALTIYDMSGCSHGDDVLEREMSILNKWKDKVPDEEQNEFLLNVETRRAWYYRSIHEYSKARSCFRLVMKSHVKNKRMDAIREYLKCFLFEVYSIFS